MMRRNQYDDDIIAKTGAAERKKDRFRMNTHSLAAQHQGGLREWTVKNRQEMSSGRNHRAGQHLALAGIEHGQLAGSRWVAGAR